jgi:hypothetical protein
MGVKKLGGAHAPVDLDREYYDEFGFYSPMPLSRPARREPGPDFPTGPTVGERLPGFVLPDQHGCLVDFPTDRKGRKAIVVFHRSAYW